MSFPTGGGAPYGMPSHVPPGMGPPQFSQFGGMPGGQVPGMGVPMRMGLLQPSPQRMRQPRPTMTIAMQGPKPGPTLLRGPVPPNTPWRKINKPIGPPTSQAQQVQDPNKPKTTVFVGNISEKAPDALVRGLLTRCGNMLSWKRVQGATGKLQAFGFCEYGDPEASLRAIRLLHDLELGDKKLVVKVDAKTRAQLDEYLADKNKTNGTQPNGEEIDDYNRNADVMVKEQLHQLMSDFQHQLSRQFQTDDKKDKPRKPKEERRDESVEDLALEDDKKHIISREIDRFRDTYKYVLDALLGTHGQAKIVQWRHCRTALVAN